MEDSGLLDVDTDEDLFALHFVFLPRINNQLTQFVNAWNRHPMCTESGLSPLQLWNRGLLLASSQFEDEIASGLMVDDDYGVDTDIGAAFSLDSDEAVIVPEIELDLSVPELEYIQNLCKPAIIMAWISTYELKNTLVVPLQ